MLAMAADHQRLCVIDALLEAGTPVLRRHVIGVFEACAGGRPDLFGAPVLRDLGGDRGGLGAEP